jgi:hypothetical protein
MEEHHLPDPNEQQVDEASKSSFMDKLTQWYQRFNVFSEIKEEDHWTVMVGKVSVRVVGILIMIALSPILLLGLFIAMVFAS